MGLGTDKDGTEESYGKVKVRQIIAARKLLGWSQAKLSEKSGVGLSTIADYEREERDTMEGNIDKMVVALERAGVEFINYSSGAYGVKHVESPGHE